MKVSVLVLAYNAEKTIERCLTYLLKQTYRDFELVIVDDGSTDKTVSLVSSFHDKRIKLVKNSKNLGIAKSRNVALKHAQGDLIFFTDSDCMPTFTWLEEGVNHIGDCDIVTGWTIYEEGRPTFKHRVVQGKDVFYTCNLGFKKSALVEAGGFDEHLNMYAEDKDICFSILKQGGRKTYCKNMIVFHQISLKNRKDELKRYRNYYIGKLGSHLKHKKERGIYFRIMRPDELASILFPPFFLVRESFRSIEDFKILPFTWLGMLKGRAAMWKYCLKNKKFYI